MEVQFFLFPPYCTGGRPMVRTQVCGTWNEGSIPFLWTNLCLAGRGSQCGGLKIRRSWCDSKARHHYLYYKRSREMLFYTCTECQAELNCPCNWHYACSVCQVYQAHNQKPQPVDEQEYEAWLNSFE